MIYYFSLAQNHSLELLNTNIGYITADRAIIDGGHKWPHFGFFALLTLDQLLSILKTQKCKSKAINEFFSHFLYRKHITFLCQIHCIGLK